MALGKGIHEAVGAPVESSDPPRDADLTIAPTVDEIDAFEKDNPRPFAKWIAARLTAYGERWGRICSTSHATRRRLPDLDPMRRG